MMKMHGILKNAILFCLVWSIPAGANLLTNGDFESGSTGQLGSVTIPGWNNWVGGL